MYKHDLRTIQKLLKNIFKQNRVDDF
jgi:hypothetical protein